MEMTESIELNCTVGVGWNSYFNPDSLNKVSVRDIRFLNFDL